MNCEESRPLLEEYFDGELAGAAAARVAAHLASCGSCAALYESLGREQEFYRVAEPEAATAANLWAGVSARLEGERGGGRAARLWRTVRGRAAFAAFGAPRFSPALTAAAVLTAVVLTAGVMTYLNAGRQPQPETASVARQGAAESDIAPRTGNDNERGDSARPVPARRAEGDAAMKSSASGVGEQRRAVASVVAEGGRRARPHPEVQRRDDTADELVREAEHKYVAAIALLARDVRRRRSALDSEEAARFERTLAAVDRAIAETRRAARSRPADPVAAQYMLAAYSKKVDLLRDMASH
ncbi:MAG TPA: zf-HC2 domain-containing protein [Pyrinomonadaceae bacterium]